MRKLRHPAVRFKVGMDPGPSTAGEIGGELCLSIGVPINTALPEETAKFIREVI